MTNYQFGLIVALLAASGIFIIVPCVVYCVRRLNMKPFLEPKIKSGVSRMLIFSACLIGSVWCLRYAVGYFGILFPELSAITSDADFEGLTWWEEIFNSMVHALQTFSMDEDYTAYIVSGKAMLREMFGADTTWQDVYGIYAAVLNLIAPIAGGAVIFEILASIFPKIKLYISHLAVWKEKYYFSELNYASLALAKSVIAADETFGIFKRIYKSFMRPIFIFTDAYVYEEDEKASERVLEAKLLGAICVRDDLSYVKKNRFGKRRFFLIDEKESGNIQILTSLANSRNSYCLKRAEVYLFTNDDAYVQVDRSVREKLKEDWNVDDESDDLPSIIPIQSYRNLISNLLVEIPLFEPLISKRKAKDENKDKGPLDLTVSILGTGHIGTEMFLSTYWFGQILNCNLHVNVLSQETEEDFWNRIDYINPEIHQTCTEGSDLLIVNKKGEKAPVYCDFKYHECDVKSSKFIQHLREGDDSILDTDYFLVALGTDEDNISVANTVKRYIGEYHILTCNKKKKNSCNKISPDRTVITYVVYDTELSDTLNRSKKFNYVDATADVYMRAVGNLRDVYSVDNVFMRKHEPLAQSAHEAYSAIQNRKGRAIEYKNRIKDEYKHWSTLAQSMHEMYRFFSAGINVPSRIELDSDVLSKKESDAVYEAAKLLARTEYADIVTGRKKFENESERVELMHKLAWLEHRRWNAFTRTKGFRQTKNYGAYARSGKIGSYKQMDIRLHPCLVECDQKGVSVSCDQDGYIGVGPIFLRYVNSDTDSLDEVSYDLRDKEYNDYDFKLCDYPMMEKTILESIVLPDDFKEAAKRTAAFLHKEWCYKRTKNGWRFGEEVNEKQKTDHRMLPFEELSEDDQKSVMETPITQYKIALALGYMVKLD